MLIVFCGVDGSGKTTYSSRTLRFLQKKRHKVKLIKPFEYIFLKKFLKNKNSSKILHKKRKPFYYKFWAFFALIDNLFYYMLKIKPLKKKYDFIICDRYFYDFLTSFEYFGFIFKWFSKIYLKCIPKPDLLFILTVKPELALKREKTQKHSIKFYKEQIGRYNLINKKRGIKINTSRKHGFLKVKKKVGEYIGTKNI